MQRELAGYTRGDFVAAGPAGEVWAATAASGEQVTITWLGPGVGADLLAARGALRALDHPQLALVHDVVPAASGDVALVHERIAGRTLTDLLVGRPRLTPGQLVGLLTALAGALAALHRLGVRHIGVQGEEIVVTEAGTPILSRPGTGVASGAGDSSDDVVDLAELGRHLLTSGLADSTELDDPVAEGLAVILSTVARDGRSRCTAAEFADLIQPLCGPEPLHVAEGTETDWSRRLRGPVVWADLEPDPEADQQRTDEDAGSLPRPLDVTADLRRRAREWSTDSLRRPAPTPGRHQRPPQRSASSARLAQLARSARRPGPRPSLSALVPPKIVLTVILVLGALTATVVLLGSRTPAEGSGAELRAGEPGRPRGSTTSAPESVQEWAELVTVLYERRAGAFSIGAPDLLDEVFTADSPLLAADRSELEELMAAGLRLRGFAPAVLEVAAVEPGPRGEPGTPDSVTLRILDEIGPYDVVPVEAPAGAPVASNPGRAATSVLMTLEDSPQGWLISSATREAAGSG